MHEIPRIMVHNGT